MYINVCHLGVNLPVLHRVFSTDPLREIAHGTRRVQGQAQVASHPIDFRTLVGHGYKCFDAGRSGRSDGWFT